MKCRFCSNLENKWWCEKVADSPDPDMERECEHFCHTTNADRIRKMNNEELANFLLMEVVNEKCYMICHGSCAGNDCIGGIVKWLNSEVR